MKVYILPENKELFEKKFKQASKHLAVKPSITFGKVESKKKVTVVNWSCDGEHGTDKYKQVVDVIPVEIEEITSGDWVLVADVHYDEGIVGMVNSKLFGSIPTQFGLDYNKCDYCGHTHRNRKKAHIVHNTVTGEWKQIGTACGKKMFEAGDICKFTVKLYEVFQQTFACAGDESWESWCAKVPDHSWQKAYSVDSVIAAVVSYRKEVNAEWEKSYWVGRTRIPGTTDKLRDYFEAHDDFVVDAKYNAKVKAFVDSLVGGSQLDECNNLEPDFNGKIKAAFADGYILSRDFYTVFFAVKMYEESLTRGDWDKVAAGFQVGQKVAIRNAKVVSKDYEEGYYGTTWFVKFDLGGVILTKSFGNIGTLDDYEQEDGTYSFMARVDFINNNKRTIRLGGRISKIR